MLLHPLVRLLHHAFHLLEYTLPLRRRHKEKHNGNTRERTDCATEKPEEKRDAEGKPQENPDTPLPRVLEDRPPYLAPYWKLRSGAIELERTRGKYAALDLRRLPDRPLKPQIDLERTTPVTFAYCACRLVHAPSGEREFRKCVGRRCCACLSPRKKLVVAKRDPWLHRKFRRLRHLLRVEGKLLHDDLLALLRMDWNLVCRDSTGFAVRPLVLEFERRKPEDAIAHWADAVGEGTRDRDFARTEKPADALRVGLGLRAKVVNLPVFFRNMLRKRRRMERREVGLADEVDRENQGIADLRVVHVEIGARREFSAGDAGKLDRRYEKEGAHLACTL